MIAERVDFGEFCVVKCDVAIAGAARQFGAVAKAVYCAAAGTEGFRVGFQFVRLDESNTALLNEIMNQP